MTQLARLMCLVCLMPVGAMAGDFDGSKILLCAPSEGRECVSGEACTSERPADVGVPAFFRVDAAKKTIMGHKLSTPILHVEKDDRELLLEGTEVETGWTIAIDLADGTMVLTLAERDWVGVLFGACTPL